VASESSSVSSQLAYRPIALGFSAFSATRTLPSKTHHLHFLKAFSFVRLPLHTEVPPQLAMNKKAISLVFAGSKTSPFSPGFNESF